jgi:hypothetical protein
MPSHIYHIQVLLEPQRAVVGHAYLPACYRHGPSFPQQCMVLLGFPLQDMSLCSLQSQCRAHRSQHTLQSLSVCISKDTTHKLVFQNPHKLETFLNSKNTGPHGSLAHHLLSGEHSVI